jgi:hypothetical protein
VVGHLFPTSLPVLFRPIADGHITSARNERSVTKALRCRSRAESYQIASFERCGAAFMGQEHVRYLLGRHKQEMAAGAAASCKAARLAHFELAYRYSIAIAHMKQDQPCRLVEDSSNL